MDLQLEVSAMDDDAPLSALQPKKSTFDDAGNSATLATEATDTAQGGPFFLFWGLILDGASKKETG